MHNLLAVLIIVKQSLTAVSCVFQVVYGVGLCIILFDVTFVGDSYVIHGTGASHTRGTCDYTILTDTCATYTCSH